MPTRRVVLGVVAGAVGVGAAGAAAGIGIVERAQGMVAVVRGAGIVPLAVGDAVFVEDILRTGSDARALIVCRDGLQIAIGPATELALRRFAAAEGRLEAAFGLLRGITRLVGSLVGGESAIDLDTRTAVASVRSTEWIVESSAPGTAALAITGAVSVRSLAGGVVTLRAGEGTDVAPGAAPRAPALWGEARRRDAIARTTV